MAVSPRLGNFDPSRSPWARTAFSLVELLVVIAIIGVMAGLLLPAVQQSRESARRVDCLNRTRQVAVALLNYEAARGHFAPGSEAKPYPAKPSTPHTFYRWSALAHALPYLEQASALAAIDLSLPLYGSDLQVTKANRAGVKAVIAQFLCPSDRGVPVDSQFGPTNYAACGGSGAGGGTPLATDGVFYTNSATTLAEITDGASRTALVAETTLGETPPPLTPRAAVDPRLVYGFARGAELTEAACAETALFNFTSPPGFAWANGEFRSAMYNHHRPPNSPEIDCVSARLLGSIAVQFTSYGWRASRSFHSGGVNVALADGACRFVRDEVDLGVWRALSTRAGEETDAAP